MSKCVKIADRYVGDGYSCFIIAEIGINHNGSIALAKKMIDTLGLERVMFGTDFPVKTLDTEIERFFAIDLTEREREDILYNNAARFLNL